MASHMSSCTSVTEEDWVTIGENEDVLKPISQLTVSVIGASLSEPHTSVTVLRTGVSIYTYVYLWTDHLPEILNLRIYKICTCTCALQIQI